MSIGPNARQAGEGRFDMPKESGRGCNQGARGRRRRAGGLTARETCRRRASKFHYRVIQLLKITDHSARRRARLGARGTSDVKNKPMPRATATRPRTRAGAQSSRARTRIDTITSQTHASSGPSSGTR